MITICPHCRNSNWDKEVLDNFITCPECGANWDFIKMPLYIITGCSGVGKTTAARELQRLTTDYVVLDADLFYNIMPHETERDNFDQVEQILSFSNNISQSGRAVIWAMAGNIDKLSQVYHARFFRDIKVVALICEEKTLRERMTRGRGITQESWIRSSVEYNEYFRTHKKIGKVLFSTIDVEERTPEETAQCILKWIKGEFFQKIDL